MQALFDETHEMFRQSFRSFVHDRLAPHADD